MIDTPMNWIPHPGEYIKEELEARGWSQRDLSYILGQPEQSINTIIAGKRGISPEMAKALADAFGVPAEFFINLQKTFELSRAHNPDPGVARRAKLQSIYPIREMIKRGWIENTDVDMLDAQIARFFEVDDTNEAPFLAHAAKKSNYDEEPQPSQLAWLYRVRQIAQSVTDMPQYSKPSLEKTLPLIRQFMIDPHDIGQIPTVLKECGVRLVFVETLPGAKIDGVCTWIENSPVIGMTLRYDRIDNFWFVLRHEIEHVLQGHGKDKVHIDELDGINASYDKAVSEEERIANRAAAEFCVSTAELSSFIARKHPFIAEKDVLGFAKRIQVHPGVVIGQIHNRTQKYDILRRYLVKVKQHLEITNDTLIDGWGRTISVSL